MRLREERQASGWVAVWVAAAVLVSTQGQGRTLALWVGGGGGGGGRGAFSGGGGGVVDPRLCLRVNCGSAG